MYAPPYALPPYAPPPPTQPPHALPPYSLPPYAPQRPQPPHALPPPLPHLPLVKPSTFFALFNRVIDEQNRSSAPRSKLVSVKRRTHYSIWNVVSTLRRLEMNERRVFVDGENFLVPRAQKVGRAQAMQELGQALRREFLAPDGSRVLADSVVLVVKHDTFLKNLGNDNVHVISVCDQIPVCRDPHNALQNKEIDDVMLLTLALCDATVKGGASYVVSNDRFRFLNRELARRIIRLTIHPPYYSGGGGHAGLAAALALSVVTIAMACMH